MMQSLSVKEEIITTDISAVQNRESARARFSCQCVCSAHITVSTPIVIRERRGTKSPTGGESSLEVSYTIPLPFLCLRFAFKAFLL
jgi:hypothetical protein